MSTFESWLKSEFSKAQLDEETFCSYVVEILKDSSVAAADKKSSVQELLDDLHTFPEGFTDELMSRWEAESSSAVTIEKKQISFDLRQYAPTPVNRFGTSASHGANPSKAEINPEEEKFRRKQKEMLLEKYGYEILEHFDENGEVTYTDPDANAPDPTAGLDRNDNGAVVLMLQQRQREEAKAKHEAEVARNKELQEKQQRDREKERRRTMKKEHRRL
eukprot:TRINITY_DN2658_c0_g2_i1.p1 TRINITY_DN2658_c0_g2~~TRINITY_DN2658_c0_g2_i1.p1  ORF type:complete len:218 (-),score=65.78 TRINITY_DN2658_c0_g2_i1:501-1154(-)